MKNNNKGQFNKGHIAWNKNKETSQATKQKMSLSHLGIKNRLGYTHTEATKKKIGLGNKGKVRSAETIQKMKEIMKGRKTGKTNKGKHWKIAPSKIQNMSRGRGKNCPAWKGGYKNKLPRCIDCNKRLTSIKAKRCMGCNIKNRGKNAGYSAIHLWIIRQKGHSVSCENCGEIGEKVKGRWNIQWANKDHAYKRFIADYIGLCGKCHEDYDITYGLRHYNKLRLKMIKTKKYGK